MRNNPFHTCGGQQNSRVIHAAVPNMDIDIEEKCRAIKMAKAFVCLQVTCQFGKYFCLFTRQYFAGLCANLIGKAFSMPSLAEVLPLLSASFAWRSLLESDRASPGSLAAKCAASSDKLSYVTITSSERPLPFYFPPDRLP